MALAPIAIALAAAIPPLAPYAASIAGAAILTGALAALQATIANVQQAGLLGKLQALLNLRGVISSILSQPLAQESLRAQGTDPAALLQSVSTAIEDDIAAMAPPYTPPSYATREALEAWYATEAALWTNGLISRARIDAAYNFYTAQLAALAAAVAVPVAAPTPVTVLPLTTVEVPGFGAVGVRVRVGVAGAAAVAPAPVTYPTPIVVNIPPITVPAPSVQVYPPQVTVQAPPAPNVQVNAPVDTAPIGLAMAGALPLMATAITSGLTASAGPNAHAAQTARYACMGGFLGPLLGLARTIGPQVAAGVILATDNPIRQALDRLVEGMITAQLDPARFIVPTTYEGAVANASTRLTQAVGFGLQAQAIAYTAEAMTPLKQMGFSQMAGFMADLAGFQRIAAGLMGTIETAAIYRPLMFRAQERFRPNLPMLPDLEEMYAKKEIPYEAREGVQGLHQALALHGLSDEWAEVYREHLWRDPRLTELIRIGQFFNPTLELETRLPTPETAAWMERAGVGQYAAIPGDWYYAWRTAKGGYDPRDVPVLVATAKRAVTRREQTLFMDATTRLVRDGFISLERGRELIREGWGVTPGPFAEGDPVEARARATDLQRDYRLLNDSKAVVLMSMSRGLITRAEARTRLGELGLDGQRVELEVLKATLGMLPGMRIAISRPEEVLEEAGLEVE